MVVLKGHKKKDRSMKKITTVGLILAKSVFQVHGKTDFVNCPEANLYQQFLV